MQAIVTMVALCAGGFYAGTLSDRPRLCRALDRVDLPTRPWRQTDKDFGQCISAMVPFGPESALRSNMNYQVTGRSLTGIDDVSILANLNTPESKAEARKRVLAAAQQWFTIIGKTLPKGLEQAIQTDKPFKAKVEDITLRYEPEQTGRVFEMRFRVEDKDF